MVSLRNDSAQPKPKINIAEGRKRRRAASIESPCRKLPRSMVVPPFSSAANFFDMLTDDLVVCVFCKLSSAASCPADLVRMRLTCKRFNELGLNPLVLAKASAESLAIRADNWSSEAHMFLKRCVDAGNVEATYILGMILFYCLGFRQSGANMMALAGIILQHPAALYSLAIMNLNGSGVNEMHSHPRCGVTCIQRSARLGHVDSIHELGYCIMDGYGDLALGCRVVSFALRQPLTEPHPANRFLVEWFARRPVGPGLRLCSNGRCGRPETRENEFRRCACCGTVQYCSRACRGVHSKLHKAGGSIVGS